MKKRIFIFGFLFVLAIILISCSREEARSPQKDESNAQSAPKICTQLTPELVREVCHIAPDLNLALSDKPRYKTSWTNCGAVEGYRGEADGSTSPPNAVLIVWYSADKDFGYYTPDFIKEQATTAPGGPRGSKNVEGLNTEYAFVTPQIGKQSMENLDTGGYILYFGTINKAQKTLKSNGNVPAQDIEGCSLEEGKELVRRLLEME